MILVLPEVLDAATVREMRAVLAQAQWHDGRATAGPVAALCKRNEQLHLQDAVAGQLGERILRALSANAQFVSFALPLRILPPMFNCYRGGGEYGFHVDNAIRVDPVSGQRIRTDVSTTLFLSDPGEYEGGELVIQDTYGAQRVKLPAGHAVVYPGTSLHRVTPVTQGSRMASFFWTQSLVADDVRRALLFDLDQTIQSLGLLPANAEAVLRLSGTYHNLVRQWAQT